MNQKKLQMGSQKIRGKTGSRGRWLGAVVGLAAAAVIAITFYFAAGTARPAEGNVAKPAAQSAPDIARRAAREAAASAANRPSVHDDPSYHSPQAVNQPAQAGQDAAQQGVMGYLKAHGAGPAQAADAANQPSVHDDPSYHSPQGSNGAAVDRSFHTPQTSNYGPVDRSFHTPQTSNYALSGPLAQSVPDAATLGVLQYLRAHGATVPIP